MEERTGPRAAHIYRPAKGGRVIDRNKKRFLNEEEHQERGFL